MRKKRDLRHVEMAECADTISATRCFFGHKKRKNVMFSLVSILNSGAIG